MPARLEPKTTAVAGPFADCIDELKGSREIGCTNRNKAIAAATPKDRTRAAIAPRIASPASQKTASNNRFTIPGTISLAQTEYCVRRVTRVAAATTRSMATSGTAAANHRMTTASDPLSEDSDAIHGARTQRAPAISKPQPPVSVTATVRTCFKAAGAVRRYLVPRRITPLDIPSRATPSNI